MIIKTEKRRISSHPKIPQKASRNEDIDKQKVWVIPKGQIISECPYEIIVSPIRPTKKFPRFLP